MKGLNRFLFLFLAILISAIAVSEAMFRGMWLVASDFAGPALPTGHAIGSILGAVTGLPGLWISIRRGATPAVWAFLGLLLLFPILGAVLPPQA
ncbi:MAG: hypothetical protein K0R83_1110 [Caulobacter sp.]|jgi:hypothetical protein|nr:hypothetical protein [Caulobacter sp.]